LGVNCEAHDLLAVWGAVVATIVAGWNIYKDFIKRERVQVEAGLHFWSVTGEKVFFLKVLNRSSHNISVTHCVGYDKARADGCTVCLSAILQGTYSPSRRSTKYACRRGSVLGV
jgi:hypothetical protein